MFFDKIENKYKKIPRCYFQPATSSAVQLNTKQARFIALAAIPASRDKFKIKYFWPVNHGPRFALLSKFCPGSCDMRRMKKLLRYITFIFRLLLREINKLNNILKMDIKSSYFASTVATKPVAFLCCATAMSTKHT